MFFDNASTTKIDDDILKEILKLNEDLYYNPGALYSAGRNVKKELEVCRTLILKNLKACESSNLIFLGSATEANNLALKGILKKNIRKILVSVSEHPSIYNTALNIKENGFNVEFIKIDKNGVVDFEDFKSKMTTDVDFISIMHVNNETGAINDIKTFVDYAKSINPKVIFHSDGVQAVGKIDVDLEYLNVDMYTISAHKIHGMKGVGALYLKKNIGIKPLITGGGQENNLRSGTENLMGIKSLSLAIDKSISKLEDNYNHVKSLKNMFLKNIENSNLKYTIQSKNSNSPYIISISFLGCRSETLLNMLSDNNIYVGNGSACSSKKSGNRILDAMGIDKESITSNLRISFSRYNTFDEVNILSENIISTVQEYLKNIKN